MYFLCFFFFRLIKIKLSEAYADHSEKRRKRGSLFFRKKKSKPKGQSTNCDRKYFYQIGQNASKIPDSNIQIQFGSTTLDCGAVINLATYKEHAIECKAKIAKVHSTKYKNSKR